MEKPLDIAEVARRTGLTSRALRFYEARGLLNPLRTHSGRRLYGSAALEQVSLILALKKAGLTLSQIQRLGSRKSLDLRRLVAAQLEAIEAKAAELAAARELLLSVKSRIDRGEPIDAATFCSLIRNGDAVMEAESWKKVADRYFTPEEQEQWADRMKDVPADFDPDAYNRKWADLGGRIAAALPLDPAGAEAQAFYQEWQDLLEPFRAVATPEMMAGAAKLYDRMGEWEGERKPPFPAEVWNFMQAMGAARKAARD
jgi:DNA-binding transcriptional MerR regulator